MPAYPYEELNAMVGKWLEANRQAQEAGDWRPMADLYTEDATYGWNIGPHEDSWRSGAPRSATSPSVSRWAASTAGPTPTRRS